MEISKEEAQKITAEIKSAAEAILARHGLTASPRTISGYGAHYTFKIEGFRSKLGRNGVDLGTKQAKFFVAAYAYNGLNEGDLGAVFTAGGKEWKLIGARDSGKHPLVAIMTSTGKTYNLPESDEVIAAIKAAR